MKILQALLITIIMCTAVCAMQPPKTKVTIRDVPLLYYISSGSFTDVNGDGIDEFNIDENIDAKLNLNFELDAKTRNSQGYTTKLVLYFLYFPSYPSLGDFQSVYIGEYGFKNNYTKGDFKQVLIESLPTGLQGMDAFCNKCVYVGGRHYDYKGSTEGWVLDTPFTDGVWQKERTSQCITLRCGENPCPKKDLGYVCYMDRRAMKYQTGIQNSDGTCKIAYSFDDCGTGTICEDGACVEGSVCVVGEKGCYLEGKMAVVCAKEGWVLNTEEGEGGVCMSGICLDGACKSSADNVDDVSTGDETITNTSLGSGKCLSKAYECTTDKKCSDGRIFAKCVNGCYQSTEVKSCETTEPPSGDGDEDRNVVDKVKEKVEDLGTLGTVGVTIVSVLAIIVIIMIILVVRRKKR